MHDRDELYSEQSLHITSDVFDHGGNRVASGEWGVYDDSKVFNLEVGFVQGLKRATVIKVVVEWHSKMGVSDGSNECRVLGGGGQQVELMTVDGDIDGQDSGDFYSMWR